MKLATVYVLGFAFSTDLEHVLLIHKNRPVWQAGLLNGIGGKVEPGERISLAMVREFKEEAGIQTFEHEWGRFAVMGEPGVFKVHVYRIFLPDDRFKSARSTTDEPVLALGIAALPLRGLVVGNLRWLIPLALDRKSPKMVSAQYG